MLECAAKGMGTPCTGVGAPARRCGACGAVGYCSTSHQRSHWKYHREECGRFQQQMTRAALLDDFPFAFSDEIKKSNRCAFLSSRGLHGIGMWRSECCCSQSIEFYKTNWMENSWTLPRSLCPCNEPRCLLSSTLRDWKDYYQWRCLPLLSPVALLLHWPLTVYHCIQLCSESLNLQNRLIIHYLGLGKEILQLAAFWELHALFHNLTVLVEFFGPEIPENMDGMTMDLCRYPHCSDRECICQLSSENSLSGPSNVTHSLVKLQFYKGLYHQRYYDRVEVCSPHIIVAPNAGIAAYPSWLPTIELIKEMGVPAFFSDYCEEAANLASHCITTVTGQLLKFPVQINPFRQPVQVEDSALFLPCYSNCFLFGT